MVLSFSRCNGCEFEHVSAEHVLIAGAGLAPVFGVQPDGGSKIGTDNREVRISAS